VAGGLACLMEFIALNDTEGFLGMGFVIINMIAMDDYIIIMMVHSMLNFTFFFYN
jgi:hypothetical protein